MWVMFHVAVWGATQPRGGELDNIQQMWTLTQARKFCGRLSSTDTRQQTQGSVCYSKFKVTSHRTWTGGLCNLSGSSPPPREGAPLWKKGLPMQLSEGFCFEELLLDHLGGPKSNDRCTLGARERQMRQTDGRTHRGRGHEKTETEIGQTWPQAQYWGREGWERQEGSSLEPLGAAKPC